MNDEKFLIEYEKLLNKDYCNCNEMNCIDNNSPRRILNIAKRLQHENEELKKQLENCYCNRTDCSSRIKDSKKYNSLQQKYDEALTILSNFWPPCEHDDFMDKNTDYCSINCGVDEEIFKKCWDRYIEQSLKEVE